MSGLVARLRATPNWQRQEYGPYKDATSVYDRAPFEAADRIEQLEQEAAANKQDAERLDFIEKNARCDPKMDGHHVWWPTTFENALRGCNLREAIDAALKEGK